MAGDAAEEIDTLDDLPAMLERAWRLLRRGVADRRHGLHVGTLVTLHAGVPRPRSVVLRGVDRGEGTLVCHADARSEKVADLRADPAVAWHFYDRKLKTQLVLTGTADVQVAGEFVEHRWRQTGPGGRATYARPHPPGTAVSEPWREVETKVDGRDRFAVVVTRLASIDHLYLRHAGHRRARFDRDDAWAGRWLTP